MIANIVKRLSVGQIELSGELIYQRYYIFENITNVIIHTHDSYFHKINHFFLRMQNQFFNEPLLSSK